MKKYFFIITILLVVLNISCGNTPVNKLNNLTSDKLLVKEYTYDSSNIPGFFKAIIKNHSLDFYKLDSTEFITFCTENNLLKSDSLNYKNYYTLKVLHNLFTCNSASNCSKGKILSIPYLWHWITPNPRHQIYSTKTNLLLKQTKAPNEFAKYNSYADIDRTPYLFLSDLLQIEAKYYSEDCDTFFSFGWCSEREMAFTSLCELLGTTSKVVASGNHSWTECIVGMKTNNSNLNYYVVRIDNTFDNIEWNSISEDEITKWKKEQGKSALAIWYNQKAHSATELKKIEEYIVPSISMQRIESSLLKWLNQ